MSNGNYSTALIVTCRECGAFDKKIVKGLCERHYKIEYRRSNADKVAAQLRAYNEKHADELKAYFKTYGQENAARIKSVRAARYQANKQEIKAGNVIRYHENKSLYAFQKAAYRMQNKKALLAWNKSYYAKRRAAGELKDIDRIARAKYRARVRKAGGNHSLRDVKNLFFLQRGLCCICRTSLKKAYHVDHIEPLSKGGGNGKENLQLLCPPCNLKKSSRGPIEHMQSLGFLL